MVKLTEFSLADAVKGVGRNEHIGATTLLELANRTLWHQSIRSSNDALREVLNRKFPNYRKSAEQKTLRRNYYYGVKRVLSAYGLWKQKPEPVPLTAEEIALGKRCNVWSGNKKELQLPTDEQGNFHSDKNLGDICDQYINEFEGRLTVDGRVVDRDDLKNIMRRYWALKSVAKKAKTKRAADRVKKRAEKEKEKAEKAAARAALTAERAAKKKAEEDQRAAKLAAKQAQAARQGTFVFG